MPNDLLSGENPAQASGGLAHNLVLPTLLFMALGAMTWAIRGCSGFGALVGCVFAGVTWGAAWWYIARDPSGQQTRRYASGWIILALAFGIGVSGPRGWMQWNSFFRGELTTHYAAGEYVVISPAYGFLWLFIAGVPWAGLGACMLAWCGAGQRLRAWQWTLRLSFGFGGGALAMFLFHAHPEYFMPLYRQIEAQYQDFEANPNLLRLTNDNRFAILHLGVYLGFLAFEAVRRDWRNVTLIATVGVVNGLGWSALQNWEWAVRFWPDAGFNWWRAWESTGGISIGIAYGLAYFLVNRPMSTAARERLEAKAAREADVLSWGAGYALMLLLSVFLVFAIHAYDPYFMSQVKLFWWALMYLGITACYGAAHLWVRVSTPDEPAFQKKSANLERLAIYFGLMLFVVGYMSYALRGWFVFHFLSTAAVLGVAGAFGLAYYCVLRNREEPDSGSTFHPDPNLERWGVYTGLLLGLGISIRGGMKGWANISWGDEAYWESFFWNISGPVLFMVLVFSAWRILRRPLARAAETDPVPHAYGLVWLVLIVQNTIALMVTRPYTNFVDVTFIFYYLLLFAISGAIVYHYGFIKRQVSLPREQTEIQAAEGN